MIFKRWENGTHLCDLKILKELLTNILKNGLNSKLIKIFIQTTFNEIATSEGIYVCITTKQACKVVPKLQKFLFFHSPQFRNGTRSGHLEVLSDFPGTCG